MADKENGSSTETKPSRRRRTATGVPGTEDGPPVDNWRGSHDHAHDEDSPEHVHPEGQDADACASQHSDLAFDQGPEANRAVDSAGPATPENAGADGAGDAPQIERPPATGRSRISDNDPQAAFGDQVINVEAEDGKELLKLFEARQKNQQAARNFSAASRDIKENLKQRGLYTGKATTIKIGDHTFNLTDLTEDKPIEGFTRQGSQRSSIKHPAKL